MIREILRQNASKLAIIALLTFIFSGFGIATLSFINDKLLKLTSFESSVLSQFVLLLLAFFISSVSANIMLSNFGHTLVYELRRRIVKQILDTSSARIDTIGKARIIASLNNDIRTISFAFMSAPSLLQGSVFIVAVSGYLFYISAELFAFVFVWIAVTIAIGVFLMQKIHKFFKLARAKDDELQASFNDVVEGHRELSLNRARAELSYAELNAVSMQKRSNMLRADIYHSLSDNFGNVSLLGLVGMCIYLCLAYDIAPLATAVTVCLAILFLRGSLVSMVGAVPAFLSAKVSLDKIFSLNLAPFSDKFQTQTALNPNWSAIKFQNVSFEYDEKFALTNVDIVLCRGEVSFLIGKNGSGKSTFVGLLCGLLRPSAGEILLDKTPVCDENLRDYQANISAVFSDFYLFSQVINDRAKSPSEREVDELLKILAIDEKVSVIDAKLSTTALSQGQRKRLGLFLALLERRSLLVLDEWAADQDPIFKRVFYREILPLLRERGISVLAISHDDAYFDVADRIFLARDGRICELLGDERAKASKDATQALELS